MNSVPGFYFHHR